MQLVSAWRVSNHILHVPLLRNRHEHILHFMIQLLRKLELANHVDRHIPFNIASHDTFIGELECKVLL